MNTVEQDSVKQHPMAMDAMQSIPDPAAEWLCGGTTVQSNGTNTVRCTTYSYSYSSSNCTPTSSTRPSVAARVAAARARRLAMALRASLLRRTTTPIC